MKCIIIDDERHCIGTLRILLENHFPRLQIAATCTNGISGIDAIKEHDPDLIFLDIAMPKLNGFEMLSKIEEPRFKIIFTTAYDSYAIKAFKVSAIDYLLKPIDALELKAAVQKFLDQQSAISQEISSDFLKTQLELFLENVKEKFTIFPNIAIPTMDGMEMVKADSILYVESDSNYSKCYLLNDKVILVSKTLKEMENVLAKHNFIRVHRSFLINVNRLSKYVKGEGGYVVMENGKSIDVSRRKKDNLTDRLKSS